MFFESHQKVQNISSWEPAVEIESPVVTLNKDITLLVVEDNADLNRFIVRFLKDHYNVISADNGKKGLDLMTTKNIQLVISDVIHWVVQNL